MDFRCICLNERVDNCPKFVIGNRRQGKSTLLVKKASETDGVIVCPTCRMADYISDLAKELGYSISKPITYDMWDQSFRFGNRRMFYFDEYGMKLVSAFQKQMRCYQRDNVKTVIIDEEQINQLNAILGGLKVCDMEGKKLKLKIEISCEGE